MFVFQIQPQKSTAKQLSEMGGPDAELYYTAKGQVYGMGGRNMAISSSGREFNGMVRQFSIALDYFDKKFNSGTPEEKTNMRRWMTEAVKINEEIIGSTKLLKSMETCMNDLTAAINAGESQLAYRTSDSQLEGAINNAKDKLREIEGRHEQLRTAIESLCRKWKEQMPKNGEEAPQNLGNGMAVEDMNKIKDGFRMAYLNNKLDVEGFEDLTRRMKNDIYEYAKNTQKEERDKKMKEINDLYGKMPENVQYAWLHIEEYAKTHSQGFKTYDLRNMTEPDLDGISRHWTDRSIEEWKKEIENKNEWKNIDYIIANTLIEYMQRVQGKMEK